MHLPLPLTILSLLSASVLAAELGIEITHAETCERKTKAGDVISVNYRGTLPSGEEFDSSYGRNKAFEFTLGRGAVIKGWDQGLLDMCIGDKRKLDIPSELAYGSNRGIKSCPSNCRLLFDTELMGISGVTKETTTAPGDPFSNNAGKEPEKQPEPISDRQNGLDHLMYVIVGALFLASAVIGAAWWRRGGKGSRYEMVGQRSA